jgi:hypothetical protein
MRGGVGIWYEIIRLYYKLLPLFTHFIQSKEHRLEVLRLLQGEVYDRKDVPVLDAMRRYIQSVEQSDSHVLKSRLTNISIDRRPCLRCLSYSRTCSGLRKPNIARRARSERPSTLRLFFHAAGFVAVRLV